MTIASTPMDSRKVNDSGLMKICFAEKTTPITPAKEAPHGEAQEDPGAGRHQEADEEERVERPRGEGEGVPAEDEVGVRGAGDRPRVGAHGEERDVAQVEQAGEPDDDVEAERERDEDAHLGRDLEVVAVEEPDERHQDEERRPEEAHAQPGRDPGDIREEQGALEQEEDEHRPRKARDGPRRQGDEADREDDLDHARPRTTSPRRPLGRKMRMRISTEKAKMSLYSAPKAPPVSSDRYDAANASSRPRTIPPSMAPGMLPMPPSTAAVKALRPGMKPE